MSPDRLPRRHRASATSMHTPGYRPRTFAVPFVLRGALRGRASTGARTTLGSHKMRAGPRDGDWLLPRRSTPTYAGASALAAIMITAPIVLAVFDVTRNMWCLRAGGVNHPRFCAASSWG